MTKGIKIYGYLEEWQTPARTEMYAYESMAGMTSDKSISYIAFPWATLIDSMCTWSVSKSTKLLFELSRLISTLVDCECVASVCQHIRGLYFVDLFNACGITDLFFPHKLKEMDYIKGLRIHPFALFPAQTFDLETIDKTPVDMRRRKYLANFVGAYNPMIYLSDVREVIFKDVGKYNDILIVKRDSWHFDRRVYHEQMSDIKPDPRELKTEKRRKMEYLDAIKESIFTLCPTGSGPNSIRIFESIDLLSIPVILTKDLHLPGPRDLWEKSCIFVEDNRSGYEEAIRIMRGMAMDEIDDKGKHLKKLKRKVLPMSYGTYILDSLMLVGSKYLQK